MSDTLLHGVHAAGLAGTRKLIHERDVLHALLSLPRSEDRSRRAGTFDRWLRKWLPHMLVAV